MLLDIHVTQNSAVGYAVTEKVYGVYRILDIGDNLADAEFRRSKINIERKEKDYNADVELNISKIYISFEAPERVTNSANINFPEPLSGKERFELAV